ncbi:hypothetical protein ZWY2020_013880 [Hordeum vulgare]|nr:hypothetical protein ZWY2020_013880 [Hordeum vulgare]
MEGAAACPHLGREGARPAVPLDFCDFWARSHVPPSAGLIDRSVESSNRSVAANHPCRSRATDPTGIL